MNEPGIDLHEWETRWSQAEEALAEDPASALPAACDVIEEALGLDDGDDELYLSFRSARETADAVERGDEVDPGDIGAAVANLRAIRAAVARAAAP